MPIVVEAVPLLVVVLTCIGALIFCYLAIYCAKAFLGAASGTIGKLPIIGGWIDSGIDKVEQKIVSIFSAGVNKSEAAMGWAFHLAARQVDWLGREISSHAVQLFRITEHLARSTAGVITHAVVTVIHTTVRGLEGELKLIRRTLIRPIHGELKALERWTYPKVRHAIREVDVVIPRDIAGLRSRTRTIENSLAKAWDAIRAGERIVVDTAFVGAIAVALGYLGLGWLRCASLGRIGRQIGCGGFQLLEDMLAPALLAFAALDICDFANTAESLALEFQSVLFELVDVENALVGCHGATAPPDLPIGALHLPPQNLGLPLAA